MRTLPNKNDVLIAYKVLTIHPSLSPAARRVAGALLDHFNRKTGRCDPSVFRLTELLNIDRVTVLRATAELCGGVCRECKKEDRTRKQCKNGCVKKCNLFTKKSHGGHRHCAEYQPMWQKFVEIEDQWAKKMTDIKSKRNIQEQHDKVTETPPPKQHFCNVDGGENATQTTLTNQSKKPFLSENAQIERGTDREDDPPNNHQTSSKADSPQKGLGMKGNKQPSQRYLIHALNGGKSPTHREAAEQSATRRLNADLMRDMPTYLAIVDKITPAIQAAAVEAELERTGSGALATYHAIREANGG